MTGNTRFTLEANDYPKNVEDSLLENKGRDRYLTEKSLPVSQSLLWTECGYFNQPYATPEGGSVAHKLESTLSSEHSGLL